MTYQSPGSRSTCSGVIFPRKALIATMTGIERAPAAKMNANILPNVSIGAMYASADRLPSGAACQTADRQ